MTLTLVINTRGSTTFQQASSSSSPLLKAAALPPPAPPIRCSVRLAPRTNEVEHDASYTSIVTGFKMITGLSCSIFHLEFI
jgi:hypothetical protein